MNLQDAVALGVVGLALVFSCRSFWRALRGKGARCSCGSGGGSCGASEAAAGDSRQVVRLPLVTPDKIGKPGP